MVDCHRPNQDPNPQQHQHQHHAHSCQHSSCPPVDTSHWISWTSRADGKQHRTRRMSCHRHHKWARLHETRAHGGTRRTGAKGKFRAGGSHPIKPLFTPGTSISIYTSPRHLHNKSCPFVEARTETQSHAGGTHRGPCFSMVGI